MRDNKTIHQWISEKSITVFILIAILMLTAFTLYSIKKAKVTEEKIKSDLLLNLSNQLSLFLPSYLLPEQKQGLGLLLAKIKNDESLKDAVVFDQEDLIPSNFKNCRPNRSQAITCLSNDMSMTAIIAPLREGDNFFGYFLKAKSNASEASLLGLLEFGGLILLILGISFVAIYYSITTLISRTLPRALDNLVRWIEAEMHGHKANDTQLCFKELDDIKIKIAEVIDRYHQSRDQAIIGQVTSGIMHDINTPLQSLVAAVHLVSEHEESSPKRLSRLENLYNMCTNTIPLIGEIIGTTLDGSRNIQITKSNFNLRDTIETSLQLTKEFSRLRNVSIEVDGPKELIASYDSHQFIRVVNNLLKNGIEAASETASDRPAKVKVSLTCSDNQFKLIVEDSGSGFKRSPDKIFRIFSTTKSRGTGLGLLISKKIVEAHSGEIQASNSSAYGGARMEVTLPF